MPAQQVFSTEFPLMWGMGIIQSFIVATGSTHTMPSYHALNFTWREHWITVTVLCTAVQILYGWFRTNRSERGGEWERKREGGEGRKKHNLDQLQHKVTSCLLFLFMLFLKIWRMSISRSFAVSTQWEELTQCCHALDYFISFHAFLAGNIMSY